MARRGRSTLIGALEKQGFDVRPDGRFIMPDGDGGVLFTLSTNVTLGGDTTSRLTLLLDVPMRGAGRPRRFGAMVACAKSLAARLDATDGRRQQPAAARRGAGRNQGQVLEFYRRWRRRHPGRVDRALRLFS
jgi:hypothetical protein